MRPLRTVTAILLTAALFGGSALPTVALGVPSARRATPAWATSVTPMRALTADRGPRIKAGRVIVRLKGATTADKLARVYESADTSAGAVRVIGGNILSWRVPAGVTDQQFAAQLEATGEVAYAELNYSRKLADVYTPPAYVAPNEPSYTDMTIRDETVPAIGSNLLKFRFYTARSWWLRDIQAPAMWAQAYTGPDVTGQYPLRADGAAISVAVLDTGLWTTHPDAGNIIPGWDCYDDDADVTPPLPTALTTGSYAEKVFTVSHGTNVAGLVGATVANGIGSFGSGYDTHVVMYKVSGVAGGQLEIPDTAVISGIRRAADAGCKIISMSFVDTADSAAVREAINYAYGKGCILVAARGNEGNSANPSQLLYPAVLPHVLGVGALAKDGTGSTSVRAYFSSTGTGLDISAPGDSIWGLTYPSYDNPKDAGHPGYDWWAGTSMAAPITAGGLALLWRAAPNLTGDQVVALAQSTAKDLGAAGWDSQTGWGELNLLDAYNRLKATYPLLTKPSISIPASVSLRGAPVTWSTVPGYLIRYNVDMDGTRIATSLSTTETVIPAMTAGTHVVTVTPTSLRNWADSTEAASRTFSATESFPVMFGVKFDGARLTWKSTEPAASAPTYHLVIDGGTVRDVTAENYDVSALAQGNHSARVSVVDSSGVESAQMTIPFRLWPKPTVKRIGGADRYDVNAALASDTFALANTAVLVAGDKWPDALSASPLANKLGGPVLLTRLDSIPNITHSQLSRLGTKKVVIVGGPASVSETVVTALRASGITVTRLYGPDRYTTANAVAKELWRLNGSRIPDGKAMVASGLTHQDALIATAVAAKKGWPVLLTAQAAVPASTLSIMRSIGVTSTILVGTTSAVSSTALAQLPAPKRIGASAPSAASVAVATWALKTYPADFIGERYYVASSESFAFADSLGVGVAAGRTGGLLLLTPATLAPEVSAYYSGHAADAVTTRIVGGPGTVPQSVYYAIKALVGAP